MSTPLLLAASWFASRNLFFFGGGGSDVHLCDLPRARAWALGHLLPRRLQPLLARCFPGALPAGAELTVYDALVKASKALPSVWHSFGHSFGAYKTQTKIPPRCLAGLRRWFVFCGTRAGDSVRRRGQRGRRGPAAAPADARGLQPSERQRGPLGRRRLRRRRDALRVGRRNGKDGRSSSLNLGGVGDCTAAKAIKKKGF